MAVRVNQSVIEVITLASPDVRVNQSVIEFIILPVPPAISCGNPPHGDPGIPYSHAFPATDGTLPYSFSISEGTLPPGLSLNASTGVVSGIPTTSGGYGFAISVTDANLNSATADCGIVINPGPLRITLRGVNRRRICEFQEVEVGEVEKAPSVKRAV